MIMNSLCALALGYVLDMALGDPAGKLYPLNLIKRLVKSLENTLRKAYADTPEAQNMAGIMLVVMTLIICLGISFVLLFVCYKLGVVAGIIAEGVLCWISLSIRDIRRNMQGVFRCARAGNEGAIHKYTAKLSNRDTELLGLDESVKCAVEAASENAVDWVIGPIFWICLLGGIGGIFCRCVNIMDNAVGYKTESCIDLGRVPAKLDDIVMFIPARMAAWLMRLNAAFLKLDSRHAKEIYKRDRKKTFSPNSGCTQAVCAGALNISLGSDEYYGGELVRKPVIGDDLQPVTADKAFWVNQLVTGTAAYGIVLAAVVKTAIYIMVCMIK